MSVPMKQVGDSNLPGGDLFKSKKNLRKNFNVNLKNHPAEQTTLRGSRVGASSSRYMQLIF